MDIHKGNMTMEVIKSFLYQLINGIHYCHSLCVLHRDLKPQNLLIDNTDRLKLADFGLARGFGIPVRHYTHEVVTLWYRAPEVLLGARKYGCPVDMWSIGCIFAEMVRGTALFQGDSEIDQLHKIFQVLGTPKNEMWPGVEGLQYFSTVFPKWHPKHIRDTITKGLDENGLDLLSKMLIYDPSERITAAHALQHPYFNDIDRHTFKVIGQSHMNKLSVNSKVSPFNRA